MWKGAITFGLVTIPVKLYAATESKDVRFHLLHRECRTPLQYRKWCANCDREIAQEEIVKGYEFERGRYVTIEEEEFESIPIAAKRSLDIVGFVKLAEIDPVYFDKTYYLEPGEGGAKAYALLRRAMAMTGRVAVARVVIRTKESLAALRVFSDRVLAMETMHFPDEVRSVAGLTGITEPELREQELQMAVSLIESLAMNFEPGRFENQYREAVLALIEAKVAGEEVDQVAPAPERGRVVDLMEALRASIRAAETERGADPAAVAAQAAGEKAVPLPAPGALGPAAAPGLPAPGAPVPAAAPGVPGGAPPGLPGGGPPGMASHRNMPPPGIIPPATPGAARP
jgi:DNA end-binding protein Ku